jgi:hypothetical protein
MDFRGVGPETPNEATVVTNHRANRTSSQSERGPLQEVELGEKPPQGKVTARCIRKRLNDMTEDDYFLFPRAQLVRLLISPNLHQVFPTLDCHNNGLDIILSEHHRASNKQDTVGKVQNFFPRKTRSGLPSAPDLLQNWQNSLSMLP